MDGKNGFGRRYFIKGEYKIPLLLQSLNSNMICNSKRYAVLGSNSFAGATFIAHALSLGAEIIGFNRTEERSEIFLPYRTSSHKAAYKFIQADINHDMDKVLGSIENFRPHAVIDFAGQGMVAESWQNPAQWYRTNILAKVGFHDNLRRFSWLERYVRISTPEVYGSQDSLSYENTPYNPSTPYAVSHAAIDMSLHAFYQQYSFPVVIGRFANFYGPGQQLYRIVPRAIIYALLGKKLELHGGGTSVRAFIHSKDVAHGILRCLESARNGEVYHFSPNRFLTIHQVVELICVKMNVNFQDFVKIVPDRPAKDKAYLMSAKKATIELGWRDTVSFEDGIDETIDWVRSNFKSILDQPLDYSHKI